MMKWEAEQKDYTCNDCYYSMQNCHDISICCEDETGLCDFFEELADKGEPMTREEAASEIEERVRVTEYVNSSYVDCVDIEALRIAIKALAQPERKKGDWKKYGGKIEAYDIVGYKTWGQKRKCTNCDFITTYIEDFGLYSFCPNCGADMRDEE